jgi:hypothetical protein
MHGSLFLTIFTPINSCMLRLGEKLSVCHGGRSCDLSVACITYRLSMCRHYVVQMTCSELRKTQTVVPIHMSVARSY